MEALVPWLLTAVAALLIVTVVLYYHLRCAESATEGRTAVFTETLQQALRETRPTPRLPARGSANYDWRTQATRMARSGFTAAQISRELEVPVGEVELVVALAQPSRSR